MTSSPKFARNSLLCLGFALAVSVRAELTFDLAADFSAAQNPNGPWTLGWMSLSNTFNLYTLTSAAYGTALNEWHGPFPSDNGSSPPDVICNQTDAPIGVSDTTWQPRQVTFHPGEQGEQSVIRWTSPLTGWVKLNAAFEGRSAFTTSGIEIQNNNALIFSGLVTGTGAPSRISILTNLWLHMGDSVDIKVDYGNGDWTSDTTQVEVLINLLDASPLQISRLPASSVRLSWPTNLADYFVESTTQLVGVPWLLMTNGAVTEGSQFVITINSTNQSQFFRLHRR